MGLVSEDGGVLFWPRGASSVVRIFTDQCQKSSRKHKENLSIFIARGKWLGSLLSLSSIYSLFTRVTLGRKKPCPPKEVVAVFLPDFHLSQRLNSQELPSAALAWRRPRSHLKLCVAANGHLPCMHGSTRTQSLTGAGSLRGVCEKALIKMLRTC